MAQLEGGSLPGESGGNPDPGATQEGQDSVSEYLHEIAQHPLLAWDQEFQLGLAVEAWLRLQQLRWEFEKQHGRVPSTVELGVSIYQQLESLRGPLHSLAAALRVETG